MDCLASIYKELTAEGFSEVALSMINQLTSDIVNGTTDFPRFNQEEHAGLCKAGEILIGASIVASYAAASLAAGSNAEGSKGQPANWEIDEYQEQLIEQWAKASGIWVDNSEQLLISTFGPMIAQGAEAKVYYREGDTSVVKERASIYSTTQKALDAIVLHNYR